MTTETYQSDMRGDRRGVISISIPDAVAIDNKYFKVRDTVLTAEFSSSDQSVVYVSESGRMMVNNTGRAIILVSIGSAQIQIPVVAVKLPISIHSTKIEVAKTLGFPDETRTYGSTVPGELWRWNQYPGLCLRMGTLVSVHSAWSDNFKSVWK